MGATVLASYNLKGGVGKTAAAVNLGFAASRRGHRVLVWDLDPQAAAGYYFRILPGFKGGGKKLVGEKRELADFIKGTNYPNLDLMPSDFSYRNLDLFLHRKKKSRTRLARMLEPILPEYDYILLDCAPGISLVAENVFHACGGLLVPLIPTYLSIRAYERLKRYLDKHYRTRAQLMPFFSMVDRRRRLHNEVIAAFAGTHPEALTTSVGYFSVVELMGKHREPLQAFAPGAEAARSFENLWQEIEERIRPADSLGISPAHIA